MARTTGFDRSSAIDGAMRVFWQKGYHACNIADLVEATGVARYGWYNTFGDKDAIFAEALESYRVMFNRDHLSRLYAEDADLETVVETFGLMLRTRSLGFSGCLACAAAIERGAVDERVERVVAATMTDMRDAFANALQNAVGARQVRALPIETLSEFCVGVMRQLSTLVRSGATPREVEKYVSNSRAMLSR